PGAAEGGDRRVALRDAQAEPRRGLPDAHRAPGRGRRRVRRRREQVMAAVAMPVRRITPDVAFRNALVIARRNLLHIKSDPEQLVGMPTQPIMSLALFVYVFGGAIAGSSRKYLQFALPGVMVQGIGFTPFTTALGLNIDFQRGLIDRFRSLPIARSAVVGG